MRIVRQIVSATLLSLGLSSSITAAENEPSQASLTQVVQTLCAACHNEHLLTGGLSLRNYDVARAAELAPTTEKMIDLTTKIEMIFVKLHRKASHCTEELDGSEPRVSVRRPPGPPSSRGTASSESPPASSDMAQIR